MIQNHLSILHSLCHHTFPPEVTSIGHATMIDGRGERDEFVIEERRCVHCGFSQQRWTPDMSSLINTISHHQDHH